MRPIVNWLNTIGKPLEMFYADAEKIITTLT